MEAKVSRRRERLEMTRAGEQGLRDSAAPGGLWLNICCEVIGPKPVWSRLRQKGTVRK